MPCIESDSIPPEGYYTDDSTVYESEEDCLDACAEGACCETDGTCSIKPQCECDTANGAVFAGIGEGCEACAPCGCEGQSGWPESIAVTLSGATQPTVWQPDFPQGLPQETVGAIMEAAGIAAGSGRPVVVQRTAFNSSYASYFKSDGPDVAGVQLLCGVDFIDVVGFVRLWFGNLPEDGAVSIGLGGRSSCPAGSFSVGAEYQYAGISGNTINLLGNTPFSANGSSNPLP